MPNYRFDRLFTPEEANQLLPELEILIRQLQVDADRLRHGIAELVNDNPELKKIALSELVERYPSLQMPATRMAEAAQKIESLGCLLKDIDQGLVDFPWEIDEDNVVFLCWQSGEPALFAWHPVEGGFGQRQALPGAPKRYLN